MSSLPMSSSPLIGGEAGDALRHGALHRSALRGPHGRRPPAAGQRRAGGLCAARGPGAQAGCRGACPAGRGEPDGVSLRTVRN